MSRNKLFIIIGLVALLSIGTAFFFSNDKADVKGKGNLEEVSPTEIKKYMSQKGNGFIMSVSDNDYEVWVHKVKRASNEHNVNVKLYNGNRDDVPRSSSPLDYGLEQKRDTLAFYQTGNLKGEIKFEDYKTNELEENINIFMKNMIKMYEN